MREIAAHPTVGIVVGLIVVAFVCVRQLQKRPVREDRGLRGVLVLAAVGIIQAASGIGAASPVLLGAAVIGLLIGGAFGAARGRIARLTRQQGVLYRQGTAWTIVLWGVGVALHVAVNTLGGALSSTATAHQGSRFGSSTILLSIAVSLGVQRAVLLRRADQEAPRTR